MLTIEGCLALLERRRWMALPNRPAVDFNNSWDEKFLTDILGYINQGKPISTGQGALAMKIIGKYRQVLLDEVSQADLDQLIAQPRYAREPYTSVDMPREVRHVGGSRLAFRCKYNPTVTEDIKRLQGRGLFSSEGGIHYVKQHRIWMVDVDDKNLDKTMDVIRRHNFAYDDAVAEFFMNAHNCLGQPSVAGMEENSILLVVQDNALLDCLVQDLKWMDPHA